MGHNNFIYYSHNNEDFQAGRITPDPNGHFVFSTFEGEISTYKYSPCKESELNFSQADLKPSSLRDTLKPDHLHLVKKAIDCIACGDIEKVVLSRTKNIEGTFHIQHTLKQLKSQFPSAFVYCLRLENEMWIGATPEILVEGENHSFKSYSLAGTKPKKELFSDKEIDEQNIVTKYIVEKLQNAENVEVQKTTELIYGEIKHLLSVITFETNQVKPCLEQLHPTPAVLGVPSQKAKTFILNHEPYSRELYTGYLGFSQKHKTCIYVNLRCGKVHTSGINLYAGGGIIKNSVPEEEWKETENKLATFTAILNQNKLEGI